MKSKEIEYLTSCVSDELFISHITSNEESAFETISTIVISCFDYAFNESGYDHLTFENLDKFKEELIQIFDEGHKCWLKYVEHIRKTFMIELSQFGFIMVMKVLPDNNETIKNFEDVWNDALKIVINRIAEAMYDSYKNSVNDAELAKAIDYADEKSLAEFFKTFQELQTYYRNDEKYDTEEQLQMHKKMTKIYQQLIQHADI